MADELDNKNVDDTLALCGIGIWKLLITPNQPASLYCDHQMNLLIGVDDDMDPVEKCSLFLSRIHEEDVAAFNSYTGKLRTNQSEIIYRYNHPLLGLIYVRCGGKRDSSEGDNIVIRGYHQNVNDAVRIEQEERTTYTKDAELYKAMSSKLMENFTSAAMYIDLQEREFKWLSCRYKNLMNITSYYELGMLYSSCMPKEYAEEFMKNASPDNLSKVLKERDEYSFSVYINENNELRRITMWYYAVDEKRRFVLSVSKDTTEDYHKEQQLAKALLEADHANKAKSVFLNNMSHDIRTPMNAIIGFNNLVRKYIDDKERALEYIEKINVSSNHLLSLINDVLDMSRIESGKMSLVESQNSIRSIVDEIETIFAQGAKEKSIKFVVENNVTDNDKVLCDKLRVNQILLNCLSNAIKFTKEGGKVDLSVYELYSDTPEFGNYKFIIKDSGIGMSEDFIKTIFDPFTREENSGAHQIQGTGLGMSICKNIVDLMGGSIAVESKQGEGSVFTITLPLKINKETDNEGIMEKGQADRLEVSLEGKRILLAEDNELNSEIATEILEEIGAVIERAENGQDAVDKIKENPPGYYDCILMDIQMPILNGYEATKVIRSMDREDTKDIVIIAMTANAFEEDRILALEAGMNDHVAKPIDVDKLKSVLGELL